MSQITQYQFDAQTRDGALTCTVQEPDELCPHPGLLITMAGAATDTLTEPTFRIPADIFREAGHRVVTFDMPHHGPRVDPAHGAELTGMLSSLLAGDDPFAGFVDDGRALLDACESRGWITPGRVVACGTSRGGYALLRLTAADPRISAVAATVPVTDWGVVSEYEAHRNDPRIAELRLDRWVAELADRPIYVAIGADDDRVSISSESASGEAVL